MFTVPGPYAPSLPATGAETVAVASSLAKMPPSPRVSVPVPESVALAVKPTPTADAPSAGTAVAASNTRYLSAPHSASPAPAQPQRFVHFAAMRSRIMSRVRPVTRLVNMMISEMALPPLRPRSPS